MNGSQPPPSIVVSNEPECCLVSPSTTACSTDDCVCHEEQSHDRSESASSTSNRGQSNKERVEDDVEEMSERGKLLAPVSEAVCVQRKLFDVSSLPGSVNQADICPIRPKPDVCLVVCLSPRDITRFTCMKLFLKTMYVYLEICVAIIENIVYTTVLL